MAFVHTLENLTLNVLVRDYLYMQGGILEWYDG